MTTPSGRIKQMPEPTVPPDVAVWAFAAGREATLCGRSDFCDEGWYAVDQDTDWHHKHSPSGIPSTSDPQWFRDVLAGLLAGWRGIKFAGTGPMGIWVEITTYAGGHIADSYGQTPEAALLAAGLKAMEGAK